MPPTQCAVQGNFAGKWFFDILRKYITYSKVDSISQSNLLDNQRFWHRLNEFNVQSKFIQDGLLSVKTSVLNYDFTVHILFYICLKVILKEKFGLDGRLVPARK